MSDRLKDLNGLAPTAKLPAYDRSKLKAGMKVVTGIKAKAKK